MDIKALAQQLVKKKRELEVADKHSKDLRKEYDELRQKTVPDAMEEMGITLYLDSWVPPVGIAPTGFLLADIPVSVLDQLAGRDFVVKLDTAEDLIIPQNASPSTG